MRVERRVRRVLSAAGTAPPSNNVNTRLLISYVSFSSNVRMRSVRSSLKAGISRSGRSQNSSQALAKSMEVSCPSLTMFGVMKSHWGRAEALMSAAKSLKLRCRARREGIEVTES